MSAESSDHTTTSSEEPPPPSNTTRSFLGSLSNFSMPTLPTFRFAGDGLDLRRPAPARESPQVIDLTNDTEVQHTRPNTSTIPSQTTHNHPPIRNFIDIDEESTMATIDSSSQSPDLELLEVRIVPSRNATQTEARRRTEARQARSHSTLRPPVSSHTDHHDHRPFSVGGWTGLRQHPQGHHHAPQSSLQLHQFIGSNHHHGHHHAPADVLFMHEARDREIILPGDLDFVTQGFRMGDVTARQPQPAPPTYDAPSPARKGFTRSPKEDDVLVCPNCEDELGTGKDDIKRQVWVVKTCGHVRMPLLMDSNYC
ncbi:MAG: hypothetical protein Q9223_002830 [Gallowayella weberi]